MSFDLAVSAAYTLLMNKCTTMIEPKDLRLGNWIEVAGTYRKVAGLATHNVFIEESRRAIAAIPYEDAMHIQLTPEILKLAGFESTENGHQWVIPLPYGNGSDLGLEDDTAEFILPLTPLILRGTAYSYLKPIRYVHQLQNLYYTLTHDELKINLIAQP